MKKMVLFLFCVLTACQQPQGIAWLEGEWADAPRNGKLTLIDFWGTTCKPCHRLFDESFADADIVAFANAHFNAYKIDAWLEENEAVKTAYGIRGVPCLVFLDSTGQEIDRLLGFKPAEAMLKEWQRIVDGRQTYPALKQRTENAPRNVGHWLALADKLNGMREPGDAEAMAAWKQVNVLLPFGDKKRANAELQLAIHQMWVYEEAERVVKIVSKRPDFKSQKAACNALIRYSREKGLPEEADYQKQLAQLYIDNTEEIDSLRLAYRMNSYAWRMAELEQHLNDALDKIRFGIACLPEYARPDVLAGQLDTEAEVLWKLGRTDEALSVVEKCIALDPQNDYFKKQKKKFYRDKELYQ